ncbi:sensor histidine kinase [Georgenia yuyongxinii]|uniref:histidine kinase n=1 Tax=Georgenia yuyongxinii TaxID=2589797 RepID=A0A552WNC9_9MICO|nr:histidine kinase [Georgenia yuyongxinii]QDC25557.1 sensor histidine kinase [Georgenia yuyongxinii]TRW44194.1 sensor histidine kinase [Georgenia yuyongxinii]
MDLPVSVRVAVPERLNAWLNDPADPLWERPRPGLAQLRNDVVGMAAFLAVALGMTLLTKNMGLRAEGEAAWRAYVAVTVMILPLAVRRRFPLAVLVGSSVGFVVLSYLSTEMAGQLTFQVAYFAALYAAVAWARDRRLLWIAMGLVLLTMTLWLVIGFTVTSGYAEMLKAYEVPQGPLSQLTAAVLYTAAVNLLYFGGAIAVGRTSWRGALRRERMAAQAERIREQAAELARRAVMDERLRIARELHDVVAHHVSVIGVQAGAARKVLTRAPDAAAEALRTIEDASRSAVGEMRSLLGVLRSETDTVRGGDGGRAPEPGLAELRDLVVSQARPGLAVELAAVEQRPGDLDGVPGPVALSLYRTAQESLANVVRHSTATRAQVTLRTGGADGAGWAEVEVVDDGQPRPGSAGSGYGLRGIRERVHLHGGEAEIGPRAQVFGWRVRVRLPLRRGS